MARGAGVLHLTVRQSSAARPRRAVTGVWALLGVERVLSPRGVLARAGLRWAGAFGNAGKGVPCALPKARSCGVLY